MTEPKSLRRRRRTAGATAIPRDVAEWFAGERTKHPPFPWRVASWPGNALLLDWWSAWGAEHPNAAPPPSHAWLSDPADPRNNPTGHALELLTTARLKAADI